MTAPSSAAEDAIMRAAAGLVIHSTIPQSMSAAMNACNSRSARVHLREAQYDLRQMLRRVDDAIAELDRDLKSDDDAAEADFVRALDFPRPALRVVR